MSDPNTSTRCLFTAKEKAGVGSEVVHDYDDLTVVVCENKRELTIKPVNAEKSRAKLCREHADYLVSEASDEDWEYVGEIEVSPLTEQTNIHDWGEMA